MKRRSDSIEDYAKRMMRMGGYSHLGSDHPYFASIDQLERDFAARGREFVNFARYDYLGLSGDARVRDAACAAIQTHGTGVYGSRVVGGQRNGHKILEESLARFIGVQDALAMVSGYGTNLSLVGHLLGGGDVILVDELSHNSIMVGTRLSRATIIQFRHNDLAHLEELLRTRRDHFERCLIIVEGLYSMDGDVPDLPELLRLRAAHRAWLMVDEAHSIGVLGETGRGIAERFGVDPEEIDLIVGTLSKTFVSSGGFIAGRKAVIDWLRFTLPSFVFSVGLAPPVVAAVTEALKIIENEPDRVRALRRNSRYFLARAAELGLDAGKAAGEGVISIIFDSPVKTGLAARALLHAGYYAPPIIQVGVPRDKPRLRFFLRADHTSKDIDGVLSTLADVAASFENRNQTKAGAELIAMSDILAANHPQGFIPAAAADKWLSHARLASGLR